MSQYRISPSATRDLNKISDYFFDKNISAGEQFFRNFNRKCKSLTQFPYLGKSYEQLLPHLRGILLDGYIVFYRINEETVEILRIVHGRQNLEDLFN